MNRPARRLKMLDLNPHFTCVLCDGYFVDATTIVECLHSFCRACIVKYLETNKFCPVCDVQVHKTKPLQSIRSDKTLQDVVYKLVPGLYQNEMKRRREFYATRPEEASRCTSEERGEETNQRFIYTPYETISLSLEYVRKDDDGGMDGSGVDTGHELHGDEIPPKRYLLCPAAITVGHLKKFITAKYDLPSTYKVEISYSDDILNENYTLMDVAYNYSWKRTNPMRFCYRIVTNFPKRRKLLHLPPVEIIPPAPAPTTPTTPAGASSSNTLEVPKKSTSSDLSSLSLVPSPSSSKQELKFVLRPRREEKESTTKHQPSAATKQQHDSGDASQHKSSSNQVQTSQSKEESSSKQESASSHHHHHHHHHHNHHHHQEQQQKITMTLSTVGLKRSNSDSPRDSAPIVKVKHRSLMPSSAKSSSEPAAKKTALPQAAPAPVGKSSKRPTRSRVKKSVGRPPLAKLAPYPSSKTSTASPAMASSVNHFVPSPVTCFSPANPVACLSPASCIGSLNYIATPTVTCLSSIMNHTQSDVVKSTLAPVPMSNIQATACNTFTEATEPKASVQLVPSTKLVTCENGSSSKGQSATGVSVNGVSSPEHRSSPVTTSDGNQQKPSQSPDVTRNQNNNSSENVATTNSSTTITNNSISVQPPSKPANTVVSSSSEQNSSKSESVNGIDGNNSPPSSTCSDSPEVFSKSNNAKYSSDKTLSAKEDAAKSEKSPEKPGEVSENTETKTKSLEPQKDTKTEASPVKVSESNGIPSPITAEKNAINVPFKDIKSSIITAEFSDNDDLGCQPDLVVDEQKLDSSDNEDEEADDDALRRKIKAIAEKDDEADTETDSGRASDISNQARSSCDDEGGSPMPATNQDSSDRAAVPATLVVSCAQKFTPGTTVATTASTTTTTNSTVTSPSSPSRPVKNTSDEHAPSKPNGIDHIINNLHRNHERKDNIGALDLSTSNRKVVQEDSPRPRPRAVANPPVLDAKHRQQTCLPAPTKQHTACVPVPKHPTSSTFHIGALSASARHAAVMAAAAPQNHLNKLSPSVTIPHFSQTPIMNSLPIKNSNPANAHFCRTPSPISIHANVGMPAFPGKTYSPVTPRQTKSNSTSALPASGGTTNSYHGKATPSATNSSPRRESVSPRRTASPSTTAASPHHRVSPPGVTSPKSSSNSTSPSSASHILPPVPSTSSYKISRPPIPMYSKKSDSYKNSHHHRFKGNLTVINPDPNGYSQKIVIKNLNPGQNQHNSNHQRV